MNRVQTGEKDRIWVQALDSSGSGVTGAAVTLAIRRQVDGYYWTGSGYQSAYTTVSMTQADSTNLPGAYYYDFTPEGPSANFFLRATSSTSTVVNDPWVGEIKAGSWVDFIDDEISSRASDEDMTSVLGRIGAAFMDLEFRKLNNLIGQVQAAIRRLVPR